MFYKPKFLPIIINGLMLLLLVNCGPQPASLTAQQPVIQSEAEREAPQTPAEEHSEKEQDEAAAKGIADLAMINLAAGEKLKVLATTTIIGDLASNVTGDLVDLTVMIPLGSDPHIFSPTPQDVAAVAEADVVLSNGLGFEEFLSEVIDNAGGEAVVIAIATGVETREFAADSEHDQEHNHQKGIDPHIWLTPANAAIMVHNIAQALSALDPANAATYDKNAKAYEAKLEDLDGWVKVQIESIPAENREMVTDHDAFGYYADRYGLEIVGAVIPAYSSNASPSAQELAGLQDEISQFGATAIFVGTTVNPTLAQQVATDSGIQLVSLYTDSLGQAGSGANTYIDYIRYNTSAIVEALR